MSRDFVKFIWGMDIQDEKYSGHMMEVLDKELNKEICFKSNERILLTLEIMFDIIKNRLLLWQSVVKLLLFSVYSEIFDIISKDKFKENTVVSKIDYRMQMITAYIRDNCYVRVADVAREFALCERQLSRICEENYGISIGRYIGEVKIGKAKELLEKTDMPLIDIAQQLGFSDAYSFGKFFKRQEGMSPIKFRNSLKL